MESHSPPIPSFNRHFLDIVHPITCLHHHPCLARTGSSGYFKLHGRLGNVILPRTMFPAAIWALAPSKTVTMRPT